MGSSVTCVHLCARVSSAFFALREMLMDLYGLFCCLDTERLKRNASYHPVLKHGPRSLTCVRVLGMKPPARNESKGDLSLR